jgi:hypothetical protein
MFTAKISYTYGTPGDDSAFTAQQVVSGESQRNLDVPIGANQTNKAVDFQLVVARAAFFLIMADQAMTVKTNNSGSPANTFTLEPNIPYLWAGLGTLQDTAGAALVDITHLYVSNTTAGTLKIRSLFDPNT